jgi:hypothetical protein
MCCAAAASAASRTCGSSLSAMRCRAVWMRASIAVSSVWRGASHQQLQPLGMNPGTVAMRRECVAQFL